MTSINKDSLRSAFIQTVNTRNLVGFTHEPFGSNYNQKTQNKLYCLAIETFSETIQTFCPHQDAISSNFLPLLEAKFKNLIAHSKFFSLDEEFQENATSCQKTICSQEKKDFVFELFDQLIVGIYSQLAESHPQSFLDIENAELQFSSHEVSQYLSHLKLKIIQDQLLSDFEKLPSSTAFCKMENLCNQILQLFSKNSKTKQLIQFDLIKVKVLDFHERKDDIYGNIYLKFPDNTEFFIYKIPPLKNGKAERDLQKSWVLIRKPSGDFSKYEKVYPEGRENPCFIKKELINNLALESFLIRYSANSELSEPSVGSECSNSPLSSLLEFCPTKETFDPILVPSRLNISLLSVIIFLKVLIHDIEEKTDPLTFEKKIFLDDLSLNIILLIMSLDEGTFWVKDCLETKLTTAIEMQNHAKEISTDLGSIVSIFINQLIAKNKPTNFQSLLSCK